MKKQALMLFAGGVMALASCTSETHNDMSQAQIDSTVNARVEEIRIEMMRQNDSLINAMALVKADSIIAAMKGGHSVTTKTTTTRTTTVKPSSAKSGTTTTSATTVESGGIKSQSDKNRVNNSNTVQGGGLKSQSDQNKANSNTGGLKSHSDQSKTGGK